MKLKISIFFLLFFSVLGSSAQDFLNFRDREILATRGEIIIAFAKKDLKPEFNKIISIDKVTQDSVFAYCNESQFISFLKFGVLYTTMPAAGEINPPQMAESVSSLIINNWNTYPNYAQYDSIMLYYANTYPSLCTYVELGTLASGRKILALKMGDNVNTQEKEARFLYTSSMHGDELTGYVLMLRLVDYLLTNYGSNPQVTKLMNNVEIWINPLANPDGTFYGGNNSVANAKRFNANNIDINRNFPDPEDGQHPDGNAWQPETQIFMKFADSLQFTMSANFHGGEEVLNYPWDTWSKLAADDLWWKKVCMTYTDTVHKACNNNGYLASTQFPDGITNGYAWYTVDGGRQDFMNYFHRCRELTLEISSTKLVSASTLPTYWNYNYVSLLNYMEEVTFGLKGIITDSVTGLPLKSKVFISGWDKDSSHVYSSALGDYHRLLKAGNYTLTYSADHYFSKSITLTIYNDSLVVQDVKLVPDGIGMDEKNNTSGLRIFPNPTNEILYFQLEKNREIQYCKIYSIGGNQILNSQSNRKAIDVSNLESGIYILEIALKDGSKIHQTFIKQ